MRDRESDDLDYLFFALPIVVLVPKSSLLSIRTTSLNPHIPTNLIFSREATSGTLLTLILLHEMMLGKMGPWWGYLQSLPCNNGHWGIPLPMSLKKDSKEWKFVSQSEAGRMIKRAEADPMGRIEGFGMSLVSLHHIYFRVLLSADTFTPSSLDCTIFSRLKAYLSSRRRTYTSFLYNQKIGRKHSFKTLSGHTLSSAVEHLLLTCIMVCAWYRSPICSIIQSMPMYILKPMMRFAMTADLLVLAHTTMILCHRKHTVVLPPFYQPKLAQIAKIGYLQYNWLESTW